MKHLYTAILTFISLISAFHVSAYNAVLTSDTYVDETVATPPNEGAATVLTVTGNGSKSQSVALVQFNLGTLPSGTVASQVTKATLTVYVDNLNIVSARTGTVYIYPITAGDWNEDAAPSIAGSANTGSYPVTISPNSIASATITNGSGTLYPSSLGAFLTFDVTAQVQAWLNTPTSNYGLAIKIFNTNASIGLDSKENTNTSHLPNLDIELSAGAVPEIALPQTTSDSSGLITIDGVPFLQSYGSDDIFLGNDSGNFTTTGYQNVGIGSAALTGLTTGAGNIGVGYNALMTTSTGLYNTATGFQALYQSTTGNLNTATGAFALKASSTGANNTADGYLTLYSNTTGTNNLALGYAAGMNITTGNNNIDIGDYVYEAYKSVDTSADTGTIRIGVQGSHLDTYIAGIYGTTVSGSAVYVSSSGQLGMLTSSRRFKKNIQKMGPVSDVLLSLQPVTYQYRPQIDPSGTPQFGLVAEDVAKVDPDLVVRDKDGAPYTVRYEAVNAMLLNEFLKEHQQVQAQQKELDALEAKLSAIEAQARAQAHAGSEQH
jgi:hypothetical protein